MIERNIRKGLLIILSSPSGGGKTSIYKKILEHNPEFLYSVSATTRPKRVGEIDGKSYHFLSVDEFRRQIEEGKFAEWALVYGHYYGTYRSFIDRALAEGKIVLMDIDTQGAKNLIGLYKEAVDIFIIPPSYETLKKRLYKRDTDDRYALKLRLEEALKEINEWPNYKYVVINDSLRKAVKKVEAVITAETLKSSNYPKNYFQKLFVGKEND